MKRRFVLLSVCLAMLFQFSVHAAVPEEVIAVGKSVGIDVRCSGLLVVGFSEESPAKASGLHKGDLITKVDGIPISEPLALRELVQEKSQITLTALRKEQEQNFLIRPINVNGTQVIGANVKSEMAGIGTITYYDPVTEAFGALGHGITEGATEKLFPLRDGFICQSTIVHVEPGTSGSPGMLQGAFDSSDILGIVTKNTACGIFGTMYRHLDGDLLPVAEKSEIQIGPAEILCNVENTDVDRFSVEISRLYPVDDGSGRNMLITVTDDRLCSITGGIVQGMSGSPIIQDGKLVGAVTHVLVNDPTRGYGIFIENMLDAAG